MDKVYIAHAFTGAARTGAYSTLAKAQQEIEDAYRDMVGAPDTADIDMKWVQFHDVWAWLPVEFDAAKGHPFSFNNTPDNKMENVYIQLLPIDVMLPVA